MWKVHVFLLSKHNDDFLPSPSEQARLSRNGMGMHPLYKKIGILKTFRVQLLSITDIYFSMTYFGANTEKLYIDSVVFIALLLPPCVADVVIMFLSCFFCLSSPSLFPQIVIIGEMVIVWRAIGKIISSVLCNIVCNNCAQCNAHTHMNRPNSPLDLFCLTGTISLCLDSFLCMYYFVSDCVWHACVVL